MPVDNNQFSETLNIKGKKQYQSVLLSVFHNAYGYRREVPVVPDFVNPCR